MRMRVHEIHPMLVHFPLALLPTAVAADAIGAATGNRLLTEMGRVLMPITAASMAVAGVAGFAAQGAVQAEGHARDILITHRNLNVGLLVFTTVLATARARQHQPSPGYLLAGLAGAALMTYSGFLGGKMVYEHGVGVEPGRGFDPQRSPGMHPGNLGHVAQVTAADAGRGLAQAAAETRSGEWAPQLRRSG